MNREVDMTKVTSNQKVVDLLKQRADIEAQIRSLDKMALIRYEMEVLNLNPLDR